MEVVELTEVSFEACSCPILLYKYRDWKVPDHRKTLTLKQIWLAQPSSFEDFHDCRNPVRYDRGDKNKIYKKFFDSLKEKNLGWTRQRHRKYARDQTKKILIKNKED